MFQSIENFSGYSRVHLLISEVMTELYSQIKN